MSNYKHETLAQAKAVLIKLIMNDNEAIVLEPDGFKLYAMNHYYAGYTLRIDGVGYEFCKTLTIKEVYALLLRHDLNHRGAK